jgi:protein TonB
MRGMNFAHQWKTPARRAGVLILVILLHVMIIHAVASGFARKMVEVIHRPIEVRIIKETTPMPEQVSPLQPTPQLPPQSQLRPTKVKPRPRPHVPAAKVPARKPAPSSSAPVAMTNTAPSPVPAPPIPVPAPAVPAPAAPVETASVTRAPIRTAPVVDSRFCRTPDYPSASKRREETGTVVLKLLIDADGHVIQSRIESSSGYERLDQAARQALSLCRFKPGTLNGKPEKSWHKLQYVWKLDG